MKRLVHLDVEKFVPESHRVEVNGPSRGCKVGRGSNITKEVEAETWLKGLVSGNPDLNDPHSNKFISLRRPVWTLRL